jgi:contractile injection system tube protein
MSPEKATITKLRTNEQLSVMFNPAEYTFDVANTFAEIGIPGLRTPPVQYVRGNARTLKMELFFDTFESRTDVRANTLQITALLDQETATQAPPVLLFNWGGFALQCVLENVTQRFTMFIEDGTPVRATLNVAFKEYQSVEVEIQSGLFIGPPTIYNIAQGETASKVAELVLGDPTAWRVIADANNIDNPRKLPPGINLIVPPKPAKLPF